MKFPAAKRMVAITGSLIGSIALASLLLHLFQPRYTVGGPGPESAPEIREIAEKFMCPCGACDGETLAECGCNTARSIRVEIWKSLESGASDSSIFEMLQNMMPTVSQEWDRDQVNAGGASFHEPRLQNPAISADLMDNTIRPPVALYGSGL